MGLGYWGFAVRGLGFRVLGFRALRGSGQSLDLGS